MGREGKRPPRDGRDAAAGADRLALGWLHTMLSSAFDAADSEGYASRLDAVTRELIRYCIRLSIYRVST